MLLLLPVLFLRLLVLRHYLHLFLLWLQLRLLLLLLRHMPFVLFHLHSCSFHLPLLYQHLLRIPSSYPCCHLSLLLGYLLLLRLRRLSHCLLLPQLLLFALHLSCLTYRLRLELLAQRLPNCYRHSMLLLLPVLFLRLLVLRHYLHLFLLWLQLRLLLLLLRHMPFVLFHLHSCSFHLPLLYQHLLRIPSSYPCCHLSLLLGYLLLLRLRRLSHCLLLPQLLLFALYLSYLTYRLCLELFVFLHPMLDYCHLDFLQLFLLIHHKHLVIHIYLMYQ